MTRGFGRFLRRNTIALLALFIALGGTTYAATALPANSVGAKQLKKNAVTAAKIKSGAVTNGKIGANAVTGAIVKNDSLTGADIIESTIAKVPAAAAADAATHATTADSATTAANASALGGVAASGYLRSTLPSGQTESGNYSVGGSGTGYMNQGFQFAMPLSAAVDGAHVEFHTAGTTSTNCPGLGQAAAGFLCVYEAAAGNRNAAAGSPVANHNGNAGADTYGFNVWLGSTNTNAFSYGSWTVKAP